MPDKKKLINEFNINTPEEEILEALEWRCHRDNDIPSNIRDLEAQYLIHLLNNINNKKLLNSQNEFNLKMVRLNKKLINQNKWLVIATWATVLVAIISLFITQKIYIDRLKTSQLEVEKNGHGLRVIPGNPTTTNEYY